MDWKTREMERLKKSRRGNWWLCVGTIRPADRPVSSTAIALLSVYVQLKDPRNTRSWFRPTASNVHVSFLSTARVRCEFRTAVELNTAFFS
jgi:hypothetical protein